MTALRAVKGLTLSWAGLGDDALQGGRGMTGRWAETGPDKVDGNAGNDTLWGGAEDDAVDFLNGGAGEDDLHTGAGDYASGGGGADVFTLDDIAAGAPLPQITDFDRQEDALVLLYDASLHSDPEVTIASEPGSDRCHGDS